MVAGISKTKREKKESGRRSSGTFKSPSFSLILETAAEKNCQDECCTVTYDRQSNIQTYYYRQSREYTF